MVPKSDHLANTRFDKKPPAQDSGDVFAFSSAINDKFEHGVPKATDSAVGKG